MIHEYALDPELLNNWETFRYLTEKFGICNGRLISRYPKRWKAMVYSALRNCSEIEKKKIEVKLQLLDDRIMTRRHEWNQKVDWLTNALLEDQKRPFHAIIATNNAKEDKKILIAQDLDDQTPLWSIEREMVIDRNAKALSRAIHPLTNLAQEIIFIDPHFDPYKPKSRKTIEEFLARLTTRDNGVPINRVEFHTKYRPEIKYFAEECVKQLPERIPFGLKINLITNEPQPT